MEIIISLAVTMVVLVAFLTVFNNSNKLAVGSRNRSVAIMMAQGLMDDIESHTYGNPQPQAWTVQDESPVTVWVANREQKLEFHKTVEFENGSFVGQAAGDQDVVTVTITWREGVGDNQTDQELTVANKELQVQVPVWRGM